MNPKIILKELEEHIPFTAAAALVSIIIMSFLLIKQNLISYATSFFLLFHLAHVLFSSIVSTAIFYNYKKKILLSLFSGILIAVSVGSISDIIFPYLGILLFNLPISFHLPLLESPLLILGIALFGSVTGIIARKTKFPHFAHVLISLLASLLYIFSYSTNFSILTFLLIFLITSVSVIVPCCLSDIIFPLLFQNKFKKQDETQNKKNLL